MFKESSPGADITEGNNLRKPCALGITSYDASSYTMIVAFYML
jgi:hypothetical protein